MFSTRLRIILFSFIAIAILAILIRIFLMPGPVPVPIGPIDVTIGVNKVFGPADVNYIPGEVSPQPTDADGNVIGSAEKKITGNVIEVKAIIEGDTGGPTKRAWAWQQAGVEFKIIAPPAPPPGPAPAPAPAFRLARVHYKLDFSSQNSATRASSNDRAEGNYSGAATEMEKPAAPFEIVSATQPSGLPIIAEVPPNNSQFSQDSRTNVTVTHTAVRFEVGKTYIAIVQAKASAELTGEGSATVLANDTDKMVLKEIKIEWM